jgi:leader peptidase (prepilin peptidase)/N-methyltransferase
MVVYFWLFLVFVLGAIVGSFLNVATGRLPLEKSLIWPGSRCGNCYQPIRWYDNLPLISYWVLRGRCRVCGEKFSIRYFLVELTTALGFVGLFYLEVTLNIHDWPAANPWAVRNGFFPVQWWTGFFFHAILFSFLLAASVCDLKGLEIPLGLTLTGTVIGLVGAVLFPWPWPWEPPGIAVPAAGIMPAGAWINPGVEIKQGLYPWPFWGPLPAWAAPGGNWQTGLATGIAGALAGNFLLRGVRFLFSTGLGKEALGLGDADLMMMAGAFLGWQPVVAAFFVSVLPGLVFGIIARLLQRESEFAFGPALSAGVVITFLCWEWIGDYLRPLLFWWQLLLAFALVGGLFMLISSFVIRFLRGTAEAPTNPG